jgi:hypothetical protein
MKARVWFEAQGQSLRARGYNWTDLKVLMRLYELPKFAQSALARGHINAAGKRP